MAYKFESITFRIPQQDKQALEAMAKSKRISTSELIRDIIHRYVNHETQQRKQMDEVVKRIESLPDVKRVEALENVIVQYLQQILYHGFRTDMWNVQYAKKVHQDRLAHELDQEVEGLAKEHSA